MALYRLSQAKILSDWCEIATETRFVFLALGPKARGSTVWELSERGRAMAVLLGDKVSHPTHAVVTSCYGNGSNSPHRRGVMPLLRAVGCARLAGAKMDAFIIQTGVHVAPSSTTFRALI